MSATVLPFRAPPRRYTTGEQIRIAKAYQQTHAEMRQAFEAERFFRDQWLPEFEAEFPEFANRELQLIGGLV